MIYRNIRNGRSIDIPSKLIDPDWEMVQKPSPKSSVDPAEKKEAKAAKPRKAKQKA